MHYCMGKMVAWGLWRTQDKDACGTCNMDKKKGCCEDKKQSVKIESKHNFQSATFDLSKVLIDLPEQYGINHTQTVYRPAIISYPQTNSPPGTNKTPIYINNCAYRI
jgi:hypothetical protein